MVRALTLVVGAFLVVGAGCTEGPWHSPQKWRPEFWTADGLLGFTTPHGIETVPLTDGSPADIAATMNRIIRWRDETLDYWQTPAETVGHGFGDCEDLACLAIALLRRDGTAGMPIRLSFGRVNGDKLHAWLHLPSLGVCIDCRGPIQRPMEVLRDDDPSIPVVIQYTEIEVARGTAP